MGPTPISITSASGAAVSATAVSAIAASMAGPSGGDASGANISCDGGFADDPSDPEASRGVASTVWSASSLTPSASLVDERFNGSRMGEQALRIMERRAYRIPNFTAP
jgi:hypothetical protein